MTVSYSGEDEIEGRGITPRPFHFLPLFTGVRGIGILRTSPFGDSRKLDFHFTEFSEVRIQTILGSPHSPGPMRRDFLRKD
jgi:hypothetical protein